MRCASRSHLAFGSAGPVEPTPAIVAGTRRGPTQEGPRVDKRRNGCAQQGAHSYQVLEAPVTSPGLIRIRRHSAWCKSPVVSITGLGSIPFRGACAPTWPGRGPTRDRVLCCPGHKPGESEALVDLGVNPQFGAGPEAPPCVERRVPCLTRLARD